MNYKIENSNSGKDRTSNERIKGFATFLIFTRSTSDKPQLNIIQLLETLEIVLHSIQFIETMSSHITPAKATPAPKTRRIGPQSPFEALRKTIRKRRSRSAPPKLRKSLIEDHFRVEKNIGGTRLALPGVPNYEDDWARDSHDFFNLIVLIPIVVLNVMNWNWDRLFNLGKKESFADAWTGEWFDLFLWTTVSYFVADFFWVMLVPTCVKSPSVILQHHIVTMLYLLYPYYRPEFRWGMGVCMSVEINTWFLIARRMFNKQGFPPWIIDLSFVSIRLKFISVCFYVTWFSIRVFLYPLMLYHLTKIYLKESKRQRTYLVIELIPPVLQSIFCILNLKWTFDLISSKLRYARRRKAMNGTGKIMDGVDKGL